MKKIGICILLCCLPVAKKSSATENEFFSLITSTKGCFQGVSYSHAEKTRYGMALLDYRQSPAGLLQDCIYFLQRTSKQGACDDFIVQPLIPLHMYTIVLQNIDWFLVEMVRARNTLMQETSSIVIDKNLVQDRDRFCAVISVLKRIEYTAFAIEGAIDACDKLYKALMLS